MKPYPKYKDSGVEWIGKVPIDWTTIQIKRLSPVKRGASPRPIADPKYFDDNGEYAWVRIADVSASNRYLEDTTQKLSEIGSSLSVKQFPGDLFLSIAGTVGKPIITKIKCCIHDGFVYFPKLKVNPKYLYYVFSTGEPYRGLGKWGTQLNLNTETVGYIPISLPRNKHEISWIVNYLDRKTAQIDDLISKKQKLIELLKEERATIINQAVTKGLNPDAPMKDSGIEWLGKIPAHWDVKKLKWLAKIRLSNIDKKSKEGELEVELCNYVDVYYNDNITSDIEFMKATARQDQIDIFSLKEGDILITKDSETPDDIAVPAFVSSSLHGVVCGYHLAHVRPYRKYADGNYLFRSFSAHGISNQFEISANGVTRFGIGKQAIDNSVFLCPPLVEQTAIAAYLDRKTTKIDQTISNIKKQIDLLKEFRTALISEVVTGKIDVRDEGLNG